MEVRSKNIEQDYNKIYKDVSTNNLLQVLKYTNKAKNLKTILLSCKPKSLAFNNQAGSALIMPQKDLESKSIYKEVMKEYFYPLIESIHKEISKYRDSSHNMLINYKCA